MVPGQQHPGSQDCYCWRGGIGVRKGRYVLCHQPHFKRPTERGLKNPKIIEQVYLKKKGILIDHTCHISKQP